MGKNRSHLPIRTCICCRSKKEKNNLIKLVLNNEQMVIRDDHGNRNGRGAYVCPAKTCIDSLYHGGRLNRAFKKKGRFSIHPDLSPSQGFILNDKCR